MKELARESNYQGPCPCQSGRDYSECCGAYHKNGGAPTPEALMRSRYSAFCLKLDDYIRDTWLPKTCPSSVEGDDVHWKKLKIIKASENGDRGVVNFIATGEINGKVLKLHEISQFVKVDGKWLYESGVILK